MNERYTVRVYDSKINKRLENLYKDCKDIYTTKNPFLVDCITRGMEVIERDLFGKNKTDNISSLYDEIHLTIKKLDNLFKICEKSAKENLANLVINQKLLSCNYNMLLGLSDNAPKKKNFIESGMYDDLPDRFEEILNEVLELYLKK